MLDNFFKFVKRVKRKNKFFETLQNSQTFQLVYERLKANLYKKPNSRRFFSQNTARVEAITNVLADEKSKIIYNSIIKFRQSLRKKDFPPSQYYEKVQYFVNEMKLSKEEVFIDCGGNDGDTIDDFLKYCPEYKQIVSFEPDIVTFNKMHAKYGNYPKITLINAGVWNENMVVSFGGLNGSGTIFAGGGGVSLLSP